MVLYLDGLHQTTSRLQGILHYPSNCQPSDKAGNIHTLPQHSGCSSGSTVVPHPHILQTWGPCTCHIGLRLQVCITLLLLPGQTPPDETAFHIGLPPGRGWTDRAHQSGLSQSAPGYVTRHTRHASVTHFRPILGNIVEVTLVTSPKHVYNSHAKETYFP